MIFFFIGCPMGGFPSPWAYETYPTTASDWIYTSLPFTLSLEIK